MWNVGENIVSDVQHAVPSPHPWDKQANNRNLMIEKHFRTNTIQIYHIYKEKSQMWVNNIFQN